MYMAYIILKFHSNQFNSFLSYPHISQLLIVHTVFIIIGVPIDKSSSVECSCNLAFYTQYFTQYLSDWARQVVIRYDYCFYKVASDDH